MVSSIYPTELKLNKANSSDISAAFLDLELSIENEVNSSKICDKRDDFNINIVNFPYLDGDFHKLRHMECIFPNLFLFLEHVLWSEIPIIEIGYLQKSCWSKVINVTNFGNLLQIFTSEISNASADINVI